MGIDAKIILIPFTVIEILAKVIFSAMATLIYILCVLPKDDRVASFRFLKSSPQRYGNSKKSLYGPYYTVTQNWGFGNRTIFMQFWNQIKVW